MLKSIFQPLLTWYLAALKTGGYPVIVLLMTMESSVLPIPGEAVIPPAAYLACLTGSNLRFILAGGIVWSPAAHRFVARRHDDVLAVTAGRPAAAGALRPLYFDAAGKGREKRALDVALRRDGHFHFARCCRWCGNSSAFPAGIVRMDY